MSKRPTMLPPDGGPGGWDDDGARRESMRKAAGLPSLKQYNIEWFLSLLGEAQNSAMSIGVTTLALFMDTLTSYWGHLAISQWTAKLRVLKQTHPSDPAEVTRYDVALAGMKRRLEAFPFYLRALGSNMEKIVDTVKKEHDEAFDQYLDLPDQMWDELTFGIPECQLVPSWKSKTGAPGVPKRVLEKSLPTWETPVCRILRAMSRSIGRLESELLNVEWAIVRPIPIEMLERFSFSNPAEQAWLLGYCKELLTYWFNQLQQAHEVGIFDADSHTRGLFFRWLDEQVRVSITRSSFAQQPEYVAVQIAAMRYPGSYVKAPVDRKTKKARHVPDGILSTRVLGNAFLNAFKLMGWAGDVRPVLLNENGRRFAGARVDIEVFEGFVLRKTTDEQLGKVDLPDGFYVMNNGLVTVQEANSILKPTTITK